MALRDRVNEAIAAADSVLCLGLDPDGLADAGGVERHCHDLLDACLDAVAAVKPNIAFFEQYGPDGLDVLRRLRARVPADRLFLLDIKRGDIGSTAAAYARAAFDVLGADAVTINPLMGADSVAPFLDREDRGVFLLARTSNPGATDFLEAEMADGRPLYAHIVTTALTWPHHDRAGFVVGATDPAAVAAVRRLAPESVLLTPGVGAQGGDLRATVEAGIDATGAGMLIPVSRGISGAADPQAATRDLRDTVNRVRRARVGGGR